MCIYCTVYGMLYIGRYIIHIFLKYQYFPFKRSHRSQDKPVTMHIYIMLITACVPRQMYISSLDYNNVWVGPQVQGTHAITFSITQQKT